MRLIESKDNPVFKRIQKLARDRREQHNGGHYIWLEGIHLCQMWLEHKGLPELAVFEHERHSEELLELLRFVPERLCLHFSAGLMSAITQVVGKGQGVGFVVHVATRDAIDSVQSNALVLDQLQDPGNVGTVLRIAAARGLKHVFLTPGCASVWSQKVLRSAQGAHFSLSLHEQVDVQQILAVSRIPVVATSLQPGSQDLYATDLPPDALWVVGNEGQGVSPLFLEAADHVLHIPQGAAVESLNVAVATALCLYEQYRQHRSEG